MTVSTLPLMLDGIASLLGIRPSRFGALIFHRVFPEQDPLQPAEMYAEQFDRLLGILVRYFNVLSVTEAFALLQEGRLPPRSLVITFDDGYADNLTVAYPILRKHGVTATFFIASGYLDGGAMFNDVVIEALRRTALMEVDLSWLGMGRVSLRGVAQRRTLIGELLIKIKYLSLEGRAAALDRLLDELNVERPTDLMMTTRQLQVLHGGGMEIGGHTMNHPILAVLGEADAGDEIVKNREHLTQLLGSPPCFFAYPNGKPEVDYSVHNVRMVKEAGYEAAFTTSWGSAGRETGAYEIPRFTPWERTAGRFCLRLAQNFLRVNALQLAGPEMVELPLRPAFSSRSSCANLRR